MKKFFATIITVVILSQSLMFQSSAADNGLSGEVQTTYGQHISYESESKLFKVGELVFTESFEDCEDIYDFDPEEILERAEFFEQERKLLKLNSNNDASTQNAASSSNHPYYSMYPIPNSMFTTVSNGVESYPMSVAEYGFRGRYFRYSESFLNSLIISSILILMYDVVPSATVYNNNTKKYEINLSLTIFVLFDSRVTYNIKNGSYSENDLFSSVALPIKYNNPQINISRNGTKNEIIMYQKSQDAFAHKYINPSNTINATFVSNVLIALLDNVTFGLSGVMIEALDLNWSGFNSAYNLGYTTPLPYYKELQLIYLSGKLAGGVNQKLDGHLYKFGDFYKSTVWFNCPSYLIHTDTGWVITFSSSL